MYFAEHNNHNNEKERHRMYTDTSQRKPGYRPLLVPFIALMLMGVMQGSASKAQLEKAEAPGTMANLGEMTVYQFLGERVAISDNQNDGRIEYEIGGRTVLTERFSFQLEETDKATFLVPNPAKVASMLAVPAAASQVKILVYVGDTRIDSFDLDGFFAYNAKLWANDRASLEPLAREWSRVARQAPASPEHRPATTIPDKFGVFGGGSCSFTCQKDYNDCVKQIYTSGCEQALNSCLAGCPSYDSDFDGIPNGSDNCLTVPNPSQANCDGDNNGDACDPDNGTYVQVSPDHTCWTEKAGSKFKHHVGWVEHDVSACGSGDRNNNRILSQVSCQGAPDQLCCFNFYTTMLGLGDNPEYWCGVNRDVNHCFNGPV